MISEIVITFTTLYFTFIIILVLSFITGLILTIKEKRSHNNNYVQIKKEQMKSDNIEIL